MRYTKSLLLALVAMLLTPVLFAQTVLTGRVLDENNDALIGASVKVYKGKDLIRGSITDYDGKFRIALDPGTYELEVTYAGYTNASNYEHFSSVTELNNKPILAGAMQFSAADHDYLLVKLIAQLKLFGDGFE